MLTVIENVETEADQILIVINAAQTLGNWLLRFLGIRFEVKFVAAEEENCIFSRD